MGMDVHGNSGNYFRNNVWYWRPLAIYINKVAPEIAKHCRHWNSNDGDGLDAEQSLKLANVLIQEIATGATLEYERAWTKHHKELPDLECNFCHGTGVRTDSVGQQMRMPTRQIPMDDDTHPRAGQIGWCNACNGTGHVRPFESQYPFDVDNVREFADFLRDSGGFSIC